MRRLALLMLAGLLSSSLLADDTPGKPVAWPPEKGKPFPNLALIDQTGKRVELSSFKGKIILIEPVGMT